MIALIYELVDVADGCSYGNMRESTIEQIDRETWGGVSNDDSVIL